MDRRQKALQFVDLGGRGLEIGPSYSPLVPKSSGADVETVDHADQATLLAKYTAWQLAEDKLAAIEPVDHIWHGGRLTDALPAGSRYDYIVASHLLEHTVDLVSFLEDCEALLAPGGRLALVLPDKRYCFDRFQPLSTVGDVVDAYHRSNEFHTAGTLLDHQAYACTREGQLVWSGDGAGSFAAQFPDLDGAAEAIAAGLAQDEYRDIHHWKFTPTSFQLIMADLAALGYHHLGPVGGFPTDGFEFFVTLGANGSWPPVDRITILQGIERELAVAALGDGPLHDAGLERTNAELAQEVARLRAELDAMRQSRSWRMTAPVRRTTDLARSLRR